MMRTNSYHRLKFYPVILLIAALATAVFITSPRALAEPSDSHQQASASDDQQPAATSPDTTAESEPPSKKGMSATSTLNVYKSPTCGCCTLWVDHMAASGFSSSIHHPNDLNQIKEKYAIAPQYRSCHTAVTPEGFVFEGHVPAQVIKRFLAEKPKGAIGLAVPGMPVGSPGMEMGTRFSPYDVLLLKADGSSSVYTRITSLDPFNSDSPDQFNSEKPR